MKVVLIRCSQFLKALCIYLTAISKTDFEPELKYDSFHLTRSYLYHFWHIYNFHFLEIRWKQAKFQKKFVNLFQCLWHSFSIKSAVKVILVLMWWRTYVMWSSEMSLMSGTVKFYFCNSFVKALRELCFAENLIRIRLIIPKI